jgi:flagellar basal-body rod modification protein FlgD
MLTPTSGESGIPNVDEAFGSSNSGEKTEMGKHDFLKLLTTQLKNQDPMDPMKGQQFATQLAQFTSVEQLTNINETLSNQNSDDQGLVKSLNNSMAAGLIGKNVQAPGNEIQLQDGQNTDLSFELARRASQVNVTIRDQAGNAVHSFERSNMDQGLHSISWNGTNGDGVELGAGTYTFEVQAQSSDGSAIGAQTLSRGTVEKVRFEQDGAKLVVDGQVIPMNQIESVTS